MKQFFLFIIGMVLAFIIANFLYLLVLPLIDWDFKKAKEAYHFKDQKLKVLVFGNSTAMDGINTELLSTKLGPAYNFSMDGASLQTNYVQLKNYLQQNEKPGKVLLFLSSSHINYVKTNELHPIAEYYYGGSYKIEGLKDIPLFKFRWLFVENIKKLLSANHRNAQVIDGQLRINNMVADNSTYKNKANTCQGNDHYNSTGYQYIWKIAALCREAGIQMEVFEMPCWKESQNDCKDMMLYQKEGTQQDSLYIHNLNNYQLCDTLLDAKRDWLSKNHLNYNGSLKVTNEVMKILYSKL
jgi:hypothetical protein